MTNDEIMQHIRERTPLDQVRAVLSGVIGSAEQAGMQRRAPGPIEMRGREFEGVQSILRKAVEVGLVTWPATPGAPE